MSTALHTISDDTLVNQTAPVATATRLELEFNVRRGVKILLYIVATLGVVGGTANFITYQVAPSPEHKVAKLMHRFDLGYEPSIPNWYSSCALMSSSALLALIALAKRRVNDPYVKHWLVLSALFLGLSIDEGVRLHEMIHTVIVVFGRIEAHGIFFFPWVVPATIFVGIVGLCYVPFLRNLDRRTALLFVAAGATYVMGAVGMDMVGGVVVEQNGFESIGHTITQFFEEVLEMLGIVIFLYALLDYIRRVIGPLNIRLVSQPAA